MYPKNVLLFIDGHWTSAAGGETLPVLNPATGETIGAVARARAEDLDRALEAAHRAFQTWSKMAAYERAAVLRNAAAILRDRAEMISELITLEQGKPLSEARVELGRAVDFMEWNAGEAQRAYGQLIPSRIPGVTQMAQKVPIGPVAAFSPWNFPVNQLARKIGPALAVGCTVVAKPPEEAPASAAELVRALADAGLPPGALNLVYGVPSEISGHVIPSPIIRKVSFTGSTAVGKQLAALAGAHMKPVTMELGGHGPAIIFDDVDLESALEVVAAAKWRNAGQVCVSPTRFLVQEGVYERFVTLLADNARSLRVGPGLESGTQIGPLANFRRVQAMEGFIQDAVSHGARIRAGGKRIGNTGNFFEPTVLTDVPKDARVMNEEPFGPIALVAPFAKTQDALTEANRLSYGLAAYAFTTSAARARAVADGFDSGMIAINHCALGTPETPLGGVKESGHGQEGGAEAIQAFLQTRYLTTASLM